MATKKTKNTIIDENFVKSHLEGMRDDLEDDDEVRTDANDASRGLVQVRRLFYGTPVEKILDEVIGLCDEVANFGQ